ncbi:Uncharacterized protein OBRU01_01800, partial [Operophtera brumata]
MSESSSSESSSNNSSDLGLLELLSDWDSEEDNELDRTRSYGERVNYMHKYEEYEFMNHGIPPLHQLLLTLRFYALGTMLVAVADCVGVSKSSAGRIVRDVSRAIARLYSNYIYVHNNTQEDFYNIARFPRVLGAVDGTHILMQSPSMYDFSNTLNISSCILPIMSNENFCSTDSNIGEQFRNRKSVFSLNVQGVCDAHLRFINVVARWPGSTHDATIFNNLELRAQCENGVYGNRWLLGDSAYPCKSYLLTPLLHTHSINELNYNQAQIKTRNTIESLEKEVSCTVIKNKARYGNNQAVVIATAVLHNICRQRNLEDVEPEIDIPDNNSGYQAENVPE